HRVLRSSISSWPVVAPGMSDASVVALLPLAGRVDRLAADACVDGVPLVVHAVRRLVESGSVGLVVVVAPESDVDDALVGMLTEAGLLADGTVRIMTGSTVSVAASVLATAPDVRVVLVHDPLRPFAPADLVRRVVDAVVAGGAPVVPVLPCSDTVKRVDDDATVIDTPDRAGLRVVQTPLGYPAELIRSGVVVPGVVPAGARLVAGDPAARRLASPVDLATVNGITA
ncbi:MAG TPA: 2-C-methyl-D-erythritol 4-phosphate cytidylyltransferase, partial [Pseudonocardiaceae bacterium]|nr:2-C-methyl-D-erythritol 4-phosphate cytidylyltransferase [Pseudonocardiaceae bacterium]